jgi:hypothetical protein
LVAGAAAPAFAQDCDKMANGVAQSNSNAATNPLKGPSQGNGANTAPNEITSTCQTMTQPNGETAQMNGPAVDAAGSTGSQHNE